MTLSNEPPVVISGRTSSGKRRTFRVRTTPAGVGLDVGKSTGSVEFIRLDPEAAHTFADHLRAAADAVKRGAA